MPDNENNLSIDVLAFIDREIAYLNELKKSNLSDAPAKIVQRIAKYEHTLNRLKLQRENQSERYSFFEAQWEKEKEYLKKEIGETLGQIKTYEILIARGKALLQNRKGGK